jgi:hypothetical protein
LISVRSEVQVLPGPPLFCMRCIQYWGHSSAGRARALQARCRRFDPVWLHHLLVLQFAFLCGSGSFLVFVSFALCVVSLLFVIVKFVLSGLQNADLARGSFGEAPKCLALTAPGPDRISKLVFLNISSISPTTERASIMEAIKCNKGVRWMPWHQEAMKDVVRCDMLWGGANNL